MRLPLIALVVVYAISIVGLTLIPGQDAHGQTWHMSFFHAFYFVSFMSTTIGFGEIPYEFTDGQRLWVTLSLYTSVIAWLYAIGTILTLVQDRTFLNALAHNRLERYIQKLNEPFYLICGYGETGSALAKGLTDVGQHVVIVEIDEQRCNLVKLANLRDYVPALHDDARKPSSLQIAGLQHAKCMAVVAVTNDNEANLKIAITSKLLHPHIKVICRADSHDVEKNMDSFGTDYIIDPYDTFATYMATAFQVPCLYLLQSWLYSGNAERPLDEPIYPSVDGHWVICGYGRFGKAVYQRLIKEGIKVKVIEAHPEQTGEPPTGVVFGRGTEADTLLEADIEHARGLIAGTDDDANNLSIVVTARDLNDNLFTVIRQNHMDNHAVFEAIEAEMVMHPSTIIADKIRVLLGTPMLHDFISLAYYQENDWACELVSRISALVGSRVPLLKEITINKEKAPAVHQALENGAVVTLGDLIRDPWNRDRYLNCIVLMLERYNDHVLLPPMDKKIKPGDRLLMCTGPHGFTRFYWNLEHDNIFSYVHSGKVARQGWIWRKLERRDP